MVKVDSTNTSPTHHLQQYHKARNFSLAKNTFFLCINDYIMATFMALAKNYSTVKRYYYSVTHMYMLGLGEISSSTTLVVQYLDI